MRPTFSTSECTAPRSMSRRFVRLYRRAKRAEETERADAQHENRGLTFWHDDDGTVVLHGRFPPEMGARILSALDAAMKAHAEEQPAAGWDDEGLVPEDVPRGDVSTRHILRRCGHRCRCSSPGHCPPERRRAGVPDRRPTWDVHPRTVAHGAAAPMRWRGWPSGCSNRAMRRRSPRTGTKSSFMSRPMCSPTAGRGRCEIEHRTAIAAETARRLCCDVGIVPVVDGANGEPLSVGRRTRSIPPAVRRALSSRDRGCRFPGCAATHRLHGHHVRHWAEGGETSLDNLILLCPTHHRLVHEGGFDVQRLDDGVFRFTNPHGLTIRPPRRRETSSPGTIIVQNESLGLAIDCETATAHWHGERIDYDHALMVTMASWIRATPARRRGRRPGTGIRRRSTWGAVSSRGCDAGVASLIVCPTNSSRGRRRPPERLNFLRSGCNSRGCFRSTPYRSQSNSIWLREPVRFTVRRQP